MRIAPKAARVVAPIVLVVGVAALTADAARAAPKPAKPAVVTVVDGRESGSGRSLVTLIGKSLSSVSAVDVLDGAQMSVGAAEVVSKSAAQVVVRLPDALPSGSYSLAVTAGKGEPIAVPIVVRGAALLTDGTNAMTGALRSNSNDGVVFGGTANIGGDPPTGAGARMVWYPKKYAFRAGNVNGDQWDPEFVGEGSVAMGTSCRATRASSVALGFFAEATQEIAVAIGANVTASGFVSTSIGTNSLASGSFSTTIGSGNQASGTFAIACGSDLVAQSYGSFVAGTGNVFSGETNTAVATDPLFVCGNGTAEARSNALTLLRNGNMTISGTLTQNSDVRLKKDVTALVGVGEKLAKLHGVSYAFADASKHPEGRHIGLLAQEVREAFPELVTEGPDGTLSVAYGNFSAVLLEALKEQSSEVASLRKAHASEIAARDAKLAERDAEIAALRKDQGALSERLARIEALLEKR